MAEIPFKWLYIAGMLLTAGTGIVNTWLNFPPGAFLAGWGFGVAFAGYFLTKAGFTDRYLRYQP